MVAGLRGELDATRKELAKSKSIEGLYAKIQEDYMASQGEIRALERRDKEREVEVFKLEGQLEQMSKRLDDGTSSLQDEKMALKRERDALERKLADTVGTYEAAKRQLIETAGDVTELRDSEAELKRTKLIMEREMQEVRAQNQRLQEQCRELEQAKEEIRVSMPDMATIREESAALRGRIRELENNCRQEERQSEAYRIEVIGLKEALETAKSSLF